MIGKTAKSTTKNRSRSERFFVVWDTGRGSSRKVFQTLCPQASIDRGRLPRYGCVVETRSSEPISMNQIFYEPGAVAKHLGHSPDVFRDWRRRGLLEDVGTLKGNGKWKYSYGDLVRLAIANFLIARRITVDLRDALQVAGAAVPYVIARLRPEDWPQQFRAHFEIGYLAAWVNRDGDALQIEYFHSIANFKFNVPGHLVINFDSLAAEMRGQLSDLPQQREDGQ
ncbi:hypothetical protein NKH53_23245 [Mesorhizobium australicum]|uniref:MerR family transcriptional regulator n=1 Tax=Mesorhizobium australicum TaxID=536018 RepID=UPI0033356052